MPTGELNNKTGRSERMKKITKSGTGKPKKVANELAKNHQDISRIKDNTYTSKYLAISPNNRTWSTDSERGK